VKRQHLVVPSSWQVVTVSSSWRPPTVQSFDLPVELPNLPIKLPNSPTELFALFSHHCDEVVHFQFPDLNRMWKKQARRAE